MQVPLEMSYRGVEKGNALEDLVREKIDKLEQVCDYLISCWIVLERTQKQMKRGDVYRVRLNVTVPPGHEIVVSKDAVEGEVPNPLNTLIRRVFDVAWRELKELVDRQRGDVKDHPEQEVTGIVSKLFREDGYGFITAVEGHTVYFHRNSLLGDDFDRLEIGTGVRYVEAEGDDGVQASTVQIVDKPGAGVSRSGGI